MLFFVLILSALSSFHRFLPRSESPSVSHKHAKLHPQLGFKKDATHCCNISSPFVVLLNCFHEYDNFHVRFGWYTNPTCLVATHGYDIPFMHHTIINCSSASSLEKYDIANKLNDGLLNSCSITFQICLLQKQQYSTKIWCFQSRNVSHLMLILLLSGQIESNPGPQPPSYPCKVCQDEVSDNDNAIMCNECNFWCHISCVGLPEEAYNHLVSNSNSFTWVCYICGCPNFHSSLFDNASLELSNSFSLLSESSDVIVTEPTEPTTSTPIKGKNRTPKFNSPKNRGKNSIKCMIVNCNGLKSTEKQAIFRAALDQHDPDLVLGCESKIDNSIATYSIFPDNFDVYRNDRNKEGGGVFIAARDSIITSDMPNFHFSGNGEIIWANIEFANAKPLYLASFYGPHPLSQKKKAVDELTKQVSDIFSMNRGKKLPNIIIGGDFNFPDISWDFWKTTNSRTTSAHQKFLDFLMENSLSQLVDFITRPISNSILDLLTTTSPQLIENLQGVPGISDHLIVTFHINMKPKMQPKPPRKIYSFQKADTNVLKQKVEEFSQIFLDSNPEKNTVNQNWETIRNSLQTIMDSTVPSKMSSTKRNLPWINNDLKRKMRKRDQLYKKARKTITGEGWAAYRKYRNMVTKLTKKAHLDYINNVIGDSLVDQPKKFWSYVKLMKTENLGIPTLRTSTKLCTSDRDKSEALNSQFKSVFTSEPTTNVPSKGSSPYHQIPTLQIETAGVEKQLSSLNPSKASGPDEIPPRLLKTVAHELAPSLTFLFQQSYDTGIVPTQWKQALVTAIYKKGPKSDPSNYRPISLTCLCCKIMEHVVLSHIAKHLNTNKTRHVAVTDGVPCRLWDIYPWLTPVSLFSHKCDASVWITWIYLVT